MRLLKLLISLAFFIIASFWALVPLFPQKILLFTVLSGSMAPTLPVGSFIIVTPQQNYHPSDIITFYSDAAQSQTTTHRIVAVTPTGFETRGDANSVNDFVVVKPQQIIGRIVFHLPLLGYFFTFLKTKLGSFLFIIVPCFFIIFTQIKSLRHRCLLFLFSLFLIATLVSSTSAFFTDRSVIAVNSVSTGCWQLPLLLSASRHDTEFVWVPEADPCQRSIQSKILIYKNSLLVHDSGWLDTTTYPLPALPDGEYLWKVSLKNPSGVSIFYQDTFSLATDFEFSSFITSDYNLQTTRHFNLDFGTSSPDGQIDFVDLCYRRNLGPWVCGPPYRQHLSSGSFSLSLPDDGIYQFYTLAQTNSGHSESAKTDYFSVQVDTTPPTVNLSLGDFATDYFIPHERLTNGNFEDIVDPWRSWTHSLDSQIIFDPTLSSHVAQIGTSSASISQIVNIGTTESTLSFKYRFLSDDSADFDWFEAGLTDIGTSQTFLITQIGAPSVGGWDSGWQQLVFPLNSFSATNQNLFFRLINQDVGDTIYQSLAMIDDVRINLGSPQIATSSSPLLFASDLGSGVDQIFYKLSDSTWQTIDTPISIGQTGSQSLDYYAIDIAGNTSPTISQNISVTNSLSFNITITKLSPRPSGSDAENEFVELWNNTDQDLDLAGWQLKRNATLTITSANSDNNNNRSDSGETVIPAHSWLRVYRHGSSFSLPDAGGTVELWYNSTLVDSYLYPATSTDDQTWKRVPDGTGGFTDPPANKFNLTASRLQFSYLLPQDFTKCNYEIVYHSQGIEKGIFATVSPADITDNLLTRDLFLGTCSQNVCRSDLDPNTSVTLNFSLYKGDNLTTDSYTLNP